MKSLYTLLILLIALTAMTQDPFGFYDAIAKPDGEYCVAHQHKDIDDVSVTCKDDSRSTIRMMLKHPQNWQNGYLTVKAIFFTKVENPTGYIFADWVAQCSDSKEPDENEWPTALLGSKMGVDFSRQPMIGSESYKWTTANTNGNMPRSNCETEKKYLHLRMTIDQVLTDVADISQYHMVFQSTRYAKGEK